MFGRKKYLCVSCSKDKGNTYYLELKIPHSIDVFNAILLDYSELFLESKEVLNLNELARKIAKKEGLKKQIDIAQIKEILRITLEELARRDLSKVLGTLAKYRQL